MDANAFRSYLAYMGWTQTKAAEMLGVTQRCVELWAAGARPISNPAVVAMRYMEVHGDSLATFLALRRGA